MKLPPPERTEPQRRSVARIAQAAPAETRPARPSMTIVRRRLSAELLDLICVGVEFLASGGRSALRSSSWPSHTALDLAARRLAKAGLITRRRPRGQSPIITITPQGDLHSSSCLWPERFWNRRWDGRWYLLMYDVPETTRGYRCALEQFFHRERLGCLQKSVWVAARDIRPLFDDLDQAASIRDYAVLVESGAVFGLSPKQMAAKAWDFESLTRRQRAYLGAAAQRAATLPAALAPSTALAAARAELFEFLDLMQSDPLMPAELLPNDYSGSRVVTTFRKNIVSLLARLFRV